SLAQITNRLLPVVLATDFPLLVPGPDPIAALAPLDAALPAPETSNGVIAWNAARSAVEIALIDCLLRQQRLSLAELLPPARSCVTYSGVITGGTVRKAVEHAKFFKLLNLRQLKIKIGETDTRERVAAVRATVGPDVSLRLDANGAYDVAQAINALAQLSAFDIAAVEQPLPRGSLADLAVVKRSSRIPLMVDESLVTFADGEALIEAAACDYFNLRLSKHGGIAPTLKLARLAARAGLKMQLGSHVGETAILSAAGRHVAAYLSDLAFVEGSYGTLLLSADLSQDSISFGHGGRAPLLRGHGLGVRIREDLLSRFAHTVIYQRED
ncbi:MAG TPA: enolase C-terminal domain-like protein, partial [Pyrinomonadaceae bacterium]